MKEEGKRHERDKEGEEIGRGTKKRNKSFSVEFQ
jgi:hypothetical protein